jgi:hypothetical protein
MPTRLPGIRTQGYQESVGFKQEMKEVFVQEDSQVVLNRRIDKQVFDRRKCVAFDRYRQR